MSRLNQFALSALAILLFAFFSEYGRGPGEIHWRKKCRAGAWRVCRRVQLE